MCTRPGRREGFPEGDFSRQFTGGGVKRLLAPQAGPLVSVVPAGIRGLRRGRVYIFVVRVVDFA